VTASVVPEILVEGIALSALLAGECVLARQGSTEKLTELGGG
jgi:hypothetical protein